MHDLISFAVGFLTTVCFSAIITAIIMEVLE